MSTYYYSDTGSVVKQYDVEEPRQLRYFSFFSALSQVFGFVMLILVGYWCGTWNDGYSWGEGKPGNDKYHYTMMVTGLVFLQGEAILIYRLFRHERKVFSKALHGGLHLIVFVLYILGFIAMIRHKHYKNGSNMYSGHSWVGVSIMVAFVVQYIAGFVNFAFPKTSSEVRSWFLPVHRAFGLIIFGVSCAQALMGFMQETVELQGESQGDYFKACYWAMDCHGQGIVLNLIVVFIILYGTSVIYLATSRKYIRQKTLDELE